LKQFLLIILVILFAISCKESSSIKSLAEVKTISDRFETQESRGTKSITIPIKISLTQNLLPRYDLQDILDDVDSTDADNDAGNETVDTTDALDKLPVKQRSLIKRLKDAFKYKLYNLGLRVGIENTYKISFAYDEFPELDSKYIKSLKMKKLFFAIEPCDKEDTECQVKLKGKPSTLFFLEKFFLNISALQTPRDLEFLDLPQPVIGSIGQSDFNAAVKKANGKQPVNFSDHIDPASGKVDGNVFYDLNVATFDNAKNRKKLKKLQKLKKRKERKNIRDDGKTFIARINKHQILEAKNFFDKPIFKSIVKDMTFMKKSLFIELHSPKMRREFFKAVNSQQKTLRDVGVYEIEGCTLMTCTEVKVNPINLVPMFERSNKIKFDTYISVNELDSNDFRYSGYLELEVKLELPL
jgi:hypothetical protein